VTVNCYKRTRTLGVINMELVRAYVTSGRLTVVNSEADKSDRTNEGLSREILSVKTERLNSAVCSLTYAIRGLLVQNVFYPQK